MTDSKIVLHVGSGKQHVPARLFAGWREIRLDIDPAVKPDIVAGLTAMPQVADNSVDAIWSAHNLEHVYAHQVPIACRTFFRVLKPGGFVYVFVPDIQAVAAQVAQGNLEAPLYTAPAGPIAAIDILWGFRPALARGNDFMAHKTGFTAATLQKYLEQAGFVQVNIQHQPEQFEMLAIARKPSVSTDPATLSAQAAKHQRQGRTADAEQIYRQLIAQHQAGAEIFYQLGLVCFQQGKAAEAIEMLKETLVRRENFAEAALALGCILGMQGHDMEALPYLRHAVALQPRSAEARYNLGKALESLEHLEEAKVCYEEAVRLDPQRPAPYQNLGTIAGKQGDIPESIRYFDQALQRAPDLADVHSAKAMAMNWVADFSAGQIFEVHQAYDARFLAGLPAASQHRNHADPHKKLKIGYVSRDFRLHSVAYFITPLLDAHRRHDKCEIFCYYNHTLQDNITTELQSYAHHWRHCARLSDAQLAAQIQADGIDILVDLSGLTKGHRLRVFGRRPAPVQITYLGYPATTGMRCFDYRLSDDFIDPPAAALLSSETPLRLQHGYFCYRPLPGTPPVSSLPSASRGYVTFGCMSNYNKLTPQTFRRWADILHQVPGSRLLLQNGAIKRSEIRSKIIRLFTETGIRAERLELRDSAPAPHYLQSYHDIDIALDSFPYNGGTTSCEALWMGVPVVSLAGDRQCGRLGLSILNHLNLPELAVSNPQDYVAVAMHLAQDGARLQQLRTTLRARMQASTLMDAAGFTAELEAAYQQVWQAWWNGNFITCAVDPSS